MPSAFCAYCGVPACRSSLGRWVCDGRRCQRAHGEWARAARLAALLVVEHLARPVTVTPEGRTRAWLCLEPLPPGELARRRGLLRHGTEATG